MNMDLMEIAAGAARVAVSGHIHPDGDCVGSCVAAALYLEKACPGLRADVFLDEVPRELMQHVPHADRIRTDAEQETGSYDLFLCLDTAPDRLGEARRLFDSAARTCNIDHHISNRGDGMINVVDPSAGSACEVLYRLLDPALVDREIAIALYIGIVTDTGVFRYSNTSPETLRTAASLLEYDFDFSSIVRDVFYARTRAQHRLMGMALSQMDLRLNGMFACCSLPLSVQQSVGAQTSDLDGISAQMALTRGVDCAVLAGELPTGEWKCSLRSNGRTDVSAIAASFGGGGHRRAAGCTVRGDVHDILLEMECLAANQAAAGLTV